MADSLIIGEQFELIGSGGSPLDPAGTPSLNPLLQGAVFRVSNPADAYGGNLGGVFSSSGYSLGAPQPTSDIVGSLLLDGERPFGYRASNRTVTLPIIIKAPNFEALIAARELLLKEVDQQTWTLRWTRDTTGAKAGSTTALPILFDCFRAQPTIVSWGAFYNKIPYGILVLTFQALPYGRNDLPVTIDTPQPLSWKPTPPPPVTIDTFASVSGTQWRASALTPVPGGQSAFWDPGQTPANNPAGIGVPCTYTKTGLAANLSGGWTASAQGTATTTTLSMIASPFGIANSINVGDQFQLAANFLSGQNTGFEGGLGNWAAQTNCTVADSSAQAHTGVDSMALTSVAAGNMSAFLNVSPTGGQAMPVIPGDTVMGIAWMRAATVARQCQMGVLFYDDIGNFISSTFGGAFVTPSVPDTTTGWTEVILDAANAPANAAWALPAVNIESTGGAGEVHYVDDVSLIGRGSNLLQTQIFTVTSLTLPFVGFQTLTFSPAASAATVLGDIAIQVNPPKLNAVTFWAGFGSTKFYTSWARLGGRVTFSLSLTDTYSNTVQAAQTYLVTGSNNTGIPKWTKIRIPLPPGAGFDYANVASYTLTITNRGTSDLRYTQVYISALSAQASATLTPLAPSHGYVYELTGLAGTARAPISLQFQQMGTQSVTQTLNTAGTGQWLCPQGVTSVNVFAIGGGGGGAAFSPSVGGGGGGGGGSAAATGVAVTPGNLYQYTVGAGGNAMAIGAPIGGNSVFAGDSVTVTANGGNNGVTNSSGTGGAAGTGGFAGGNGGAGVVSSSGGGGGGGSSGGTAAGGNAGGAGSGSNGGAAGAAVTGGGIGGIGGTLSQYNGQTPKSGYGGGAGGSPGNAHGAGYHPGYSGVVILTYNQTPTFSTLLVHRPPVTAPPELLPFVSPSPSDTPNGSINYPILSLIPGVQPRFGGTYTVVAVAWSWNNPSASRTITVTVTQNEQAGGAAYTSSVAATLTPNTLPATSDTNAGFGPMVIVGELTLPVQDIPPDNTHCVFSASITDTNTSDQFMEILFLDTMGSTVLIQSPTAYVNYYLDEAPTDRDIGLIGGSLYDRGDAISVIDRATVAGGPMTVDPYGNPMLLVYSAEGAPSAQISYFPRWYLDRYA